MVIGIITAIAACPAIIGTAEAVRQGQKAQACEEHRGRKSNLVCQLLSLCRESANFNGALIVLKNGKVHASPLTFRSTHC